MVVNMSANYSFDHRLLVIKLLVLVYPNLVLDPMLPRYLTLFGESWRTHSEIFQIKTFAKSDGDDYVINGSKFWITNGHNADWCCLLVNTNDGPVHKSKSLVCVPMDTPGVVRGKRIEKIGMRSSDTAQLFFEDVRVPKKNIIGQEGKGFIYQMQQFQQERIYCVAITLKALELVINETIDVSCLFQPLLDRFLENSSMQTLWVNSSNRRF